MRDTKDGAKNNKCILVAIALGIVVLGVGAIFISKNSSIRENADVEESSGILGVPGGNGDQKMPMGEASDSQRKGPDFSNIDYAAVATKLGLTEDVVKAALTVESGERLDLEKAATTLGVSVEDLRTALGIPDMKNAPGPGENVSDDAE